MNARRDIPWHVGVSDESYGTQVWISRIENLKCHLRIIANYLGDSAPAHLRKQVQAAIVEAERYIADAVPSDEQEVPEGEAA